MTPDSRHSAAPLSSSIVAPIAAYQRLATRVIHRAFLDLESPSTTERETARTFLAGSPMLRFWCQLAQLNAGRVVARMTVGFADVPRDAADAARYGTAPMPMASPVIR
jgi:hypothetical protein